MEQIEEGIFLAVMVLIFCFALSCLFAEKKMVMKLGEYVYRNYHQEALMEEVWRKWEID